MDREKFESVISRCNEGDIIKIAQLDPGGHGQYVDVKSGRKQSIATPYYFVIKTSTEGSDRPAIIVSRNQQYRESAFTPKGHLHPPFITFAYDQIDGIEKVCNNG